MKPKRLQEILMSKHPLWQTEFEDYLKVLDFGASKYSPNGWLEPNGARTSFKEYHDSIFHHLAKSFAGQRLDDESGLDHLLHVITNAQMLYTRIHREIYNDKDVKEKVEKLISSIDINLQTPLLKKTYLCAPWLQNDIIVSLEENEPKHRPIETRSSSGGYEDEEE